MNNKDYINLVNNNCFSQDIKVPLDNPFVDDRGVIQNLWLGQSGSITFITSKQGAIRAQHRHTDDWHSTFIIEGQVKYIEEESGTHTEWIFGKGEQFFTRPGIYHEMHFITDCKMITINNLRKDHETYEGDVKRGK